MYGCINIILISFMKHFVAVHDLIANFVFVILLQPTGTSLDKIVSDYQAIYGQMDEDTILRKCKNAINRLEKADKEVGGDFNSGTSHTCS